MPRKKVLNTRDEQLAKLKPDIDFMKKKFAENKLNIYIEGPSGNTLLGAALKYMHLQQRHSQKRKSAELQVGLEEEKD
jgi:hypothetical protein